MAVNEKREDYLVNEKGGHEMAFEGVHLRVVGRVVCSESRRDPRSQPAHRPSLKARRLPSEENA